jgi:uncharacterized membrane protein YsdA (DUF1294 family)
MILYYLILINLIAFLAFGVDKYKAIHHKWRIPEAHLFLLAFLGGSLGALLGMLIFHHKTRKPAFQIGIPALLIVTLIILYFLYA